MGDATIVVSIAGNPNCGKTTLFNALTGARQRVGNWPGVTVDRKSGQYRDGSGQVEVVDLPGVYTLGAIPGMDSLDEQIAQSAILDGKTQVVVNVLDASNLERNLYLTAQLIEMRVPLVVAVNMVDIARKQGIAVDPAHLAEHLGCRVVPVVASRGEGLADLKAAIRATADEATAPASTMAYGGCVEKAIAEILPQITDQAAARGVDARWLATKLLEGDVAARQIAGQAPVQAVARMVPQIEAEQGEDVDILIAGARYSFANRLSHHVLTRKGIAGRSTSDRLDRIALNRWLGLPVFLGLMYLMFMFTINLGGAFVDFFDIAAATIFVDGFGSLLTSLGSPDWLRVILANGFGGGIQVVATFIPIIGLLYIFLSILEDSGYMARAAFMMDRYMRAIGLPGKAFVPLIVGFGCNVPAIMASRTLEQQRDRTMSVLMTPFMSCGARLAVYALFVAAFFPSGGANVVFGLYLIGIAAAVGTGFLLKHSLLKGEISAFVMELPSYHMPNAKSVLLHSWGRLKSFIFGAGKIIVLVVVLLSFLNSAGTDGSFGNEDSEHSVLSAVGRAMVPAFKPLGITEENWPATVGIFTGIFAKEAVVGTLDSLYTALGRETGESVGDEPFSLIGGLGEALATIPENLAGLGDLLFDPLGINASGLESPEAAAAAQGMSDQGFGAMVARFDGRAGAFAYMLFILLYVPCVAALGAISREIGPRWMSFAAVWSLSLGYSAAVIFYQGATFVRHPAASSAWIAGLLAVLALAFSMMRAQGKRQMRVAGAVASE